MVRGVQKFREYFAEFPEAFVIIGGVACDLWFSARDLRFRRTDDIDAVLLVEAIDRNFRQRFREFVRDGAYTVWRRSDGGVSFHRFEDPKADGFPAMVELFCRAPENIVLIEGQHLVPVRATGISSLSAILLDDAYYDLIRENRELQDGLPVVTAAALIPLKTRAWLDLKNRRAQGESVDAGDLKKHRNDVFRLAMTLPSERGPEISESIRGDLKMFNTAFPADSKDWPGIRAAMKSSPGGVLPPANDLLEVLVLYFGL